ncbi:hypothetical protein [Legionella quinlivanii]|uniref:hypothetical protein n=1 Tax=Legionella quinlivanii TaxID=45073 RepID=UPI002243FC4B|nr:hypothetical protein [Legionella quinlivanii]MCW8450766.1 hypothetical protein [Legionella quinlivanii]
MSTNEKEIEKRLREEIIAKENASIQATYEAKKRIAAETDWANSQPYWKEVDDKATHLMDRSMEGFTEWSTGASELVNAFMKLNIALRVTFANSHPVENAIIWLGGKAMDVVKAGAEKVGIYTPQPEEAVDYAVNFDADGKLTTHLRYKDEEFTKEQKDLVDTGLMVWLKKNGFKRESDNTIKNVATGKPMTQDDYIKMNADSKNGLRAHFIKHFQMAFNNVNENTEENTSRPSMR